MNTALKTNLKNRATNIALASALALGGAAFSVNSYAAGTATGSFGVSATVVSACTVSGTALAFPTNVNALAGASGSSTVTAVCTNGSAYTIALDQGLHAATTQRKMISGSDLLNYALYSDAGHLTAWGGVGTTVPGTGNGLGQDLTVYGDIPIQTGAKTGVYADTVTATITF
jgi:spore coat protein U-like protein